MVEVCSEIEGENQSYKYCTRATPFHRCFSSVAVLNFYSLPSTIMKSLRNLGLQFLRHFVKVEIGEMLMKLFDTYVGRDSKGQRYRHIRLWRLWIDLRRSRGRRRLCED